MPKIQVYNSQAASADTAAEGVSKMHSMAILIAVRLGDCKEPRHRRIADRKLNGLQAIAREDFLARIKERFDKVTQHNVRESLLCQRSSK